jgi:hypothetical protein
MRRVGSSASKIETITADEAAGTDANVKSSGA